MENIDKQDTPTQPSSEVSDEPCCRISSLLEESLHRQGAYWGRYLNAHDFKASCSHCKSGNQPQTLHALARLEWMLAEGREQISGLFTREEITFLVTTFRGNFDATRSGYDYATSICKWFKTDIKHYRETSSADFIERLLYLSATQSAALTDAIEVGWHTESNDEAMDVMEDYGVSFS